MRLLKTARQWLSAKETRPKSNLMQIVAPSARDRWMQPGLSGYTPTLVESVLRGAFSGDLVSQWQLFDMMENTWPRLLKNLNELKRGVIGLEWTVQPWAEKGEQPTPEAQERADLVEHAIWSMRPDPAGEENDFEGTIRDVMDAWGKGLSVLEMDWEVRGLETGDRKQGTGLMPRCTRWIHPQYYGYPGDSARLRLRPGSTSEWIDFPENKFLVAAAKAKSGHVIGAALLRSLAFWWCAANFSAGWLLRFCELYGQPIRWATFDSNLSAADQSKLADMLENMGSSAWAMFPAGTTMELKEVVKGGQDNPQVNLIHLSDTLCDILILGQTLTTDAGDRGTQALGTVHQGVRDDLIQAAAEWVAGVLNLQFVPALCRLNYGDDVELPWFAPSRKQLKDAKGMAERDEILLRSGVQMPKQWFYERHDIPMPADGDDVISGPRPQAMPGFGGTPGADPNVDLTQAVHAKDATDKLIDTVLEDLTGVEAKWLGGVKPFFKDLVQAAQNDALSDAEFVRVLEQSQRKIPELFGKLDRGALAGALESAMGAACVNGAVTGAMRRRVR